MAEKILNTRIQLKYDTLANWTASSFKLKAGELAIVTLGNVVDGSAGKADQHPVLFKVGTGDHTFSELPYASALAADVYAWAKASDVVLEGKVIKFKNGDNVVKSITLNYLNQSEVDALILVETNRAKGEEARIEGLVTAEAAAARAAEKALGERIDAFNLPENGFASKDDFDALKNKVEDEDGALAKANSAYELAESKVATSDFNTFKSENTQAIADAQAAAEGKVTALANGAVKDNADAIAAINNADSGILKQAKDYADGLDSAMDGRMDVVEAAKHTHANKDLLDTYTQTEANLADAVAKKHEHANKAVLDGISADKVAAWDAAEQNAKDYADDLKDAILGGEGLKDTFDTLLEIQNWIEGDGINATELTEAIAAEAKLRGEEDTKLQNQINALGIVDGKVASAEKADEASSLDATGVEQVKGIKVNNATNADVANSLTDAAKAEVKAVKVDNAAKADDSDKLGGVAASSYALKTDAQGYADQALIDAKAYADQAELDAITSAKAYTDGREVEIKKYADQAEADAIASAKSYTDGREAAIKTAYEAYADQAEADAKAYADGLAGNYATAAQGAKADSALQSIEAGTGLKVSAKADNKQTIDIDESVVFVFDCGSATKLID